MYRLILLFSFCTLNSLQAYRIPNVKLERLSQGFRVSIPDEPGISSVFYGFEINEMCPLLMEYVNKAESGHWTMKQTKTELMTNDNVVLFVMVQQNNDIFKATQKIQIGQGNEFTVLRIEDNKLSDECIETNTIKTDSEEKLLEDGTCKSSETSVNNAVNFCAGQIIFDESFDNTAKLNSSRWSYDIRLRLDSSVSEFVVFDNKDMNHFIEDGVLNIVPTIAAESIRSGSLNLGSRCTAIVNPNRDCSIVSNEHFLLLPPVHSTQIHTMKTFSFKYGRVEIRAKLPQGDWILPYMLLQPVSMVVDSEQSSNIRIAFARGNKRLVSKENIENGGSRLYSGMYSWNGPEYDVTSNLKHEEHFGNDFHIYSLTWSKTGISVAVDGENYGEITDNFNRFQEECYLILGVSVGGHREFDDNSRTGPTLTKKPWTNTSPKALVDFWKNKDVWQKTWNGDEGLKVDYVRVYAL